MAGEQVLALLGDVMLGRGVARRLHRVGPGGLVSPQLRDLLAGADLTLANLECCVSARGDPWPGKRFHFRAPPEAVDTLAWLGVDCVTLANNHALDYGHVALADTTDHLRRAGIAWVGAGADAAEARTPAVLDAGPLRVAVVGATDHPPDFAAGRSRPGVAYADLARGVPGWLADLVGRCRELADVVVASPHWGPNMTRSPLPYVRRAADALVAAGATLVAGHSAHVFHGVAGRVAFDLGDALDDYVVDPVLRNDLGLLALVTVDATGPVELAGVPLALQTGYTTLATGADRRWVLHRFARACEELGTPVTDDGERALVRLR